MSGTAGTHSVTSAHAPAVDARHADPAVVGSAPAAEPVTSGPIPVEQVPLDPRAIARASLDAARNVSLWWTSSGIVVSIVVALLVGARQGAFVLAGVALVGALVRAVFPSPGPVALSFRSKPIDVTVLVLLGGGVAVLAQVLPS